MLKNMQVKKDERYEADYRRRDALEAAQMERFLLIQENMTTQDTNFASFSSYVTKTLVSMRNKMDSNHAATIARINHIISIQNENHYHYAQFYREMCDYLDHHFGNDGQCWHLGVRPMPRGREWRLGDGLLYIWIKHIIEHLYDAFHILSHHAFWVFLLFFFVFKLMSWQFYHLFQVWQWLRYVYWLLDGTTIMFFKFPFYLCLSNSIYLMSRM